MSGVVIIALFGAFFLIWGKSDPTTSPLDTPFVEVAEKSGISFVNDPIAIPAISNEALKDAVLADMTGGVAVADVNRDGWDDIYFTNLGHDRLYLNNGDFTFRDGTEVWSVPENKGGVGALLGDINNDGWVDLFAYNKEGPNYLLLNKRDHFEEVIYDSILFEDMITFGAAFADTDQDGDLDLYVANYGNYNRHETTEGADNRTAERDYFFLNENGIFQVIDAGTDDQNRWGLGAAFFDLNNDGWQDLYVVNDFGQDQIYRNDEGIFKEITNEALPSEVSHGMNVSFGDYNSDGFLDIFVTNIIDYPDFSDHGNFLLENKAGTSFQNVAETAGVEDGGWGWGGVFGDFDNDGDLDIFHVNGFDKSVENPKEADFSRFFENIENIFHERAEAWGLKENKNGRGVAYADFDKDGNIDLVINNNSNTPSLFKNNGTGNNWIGFLLSGDTIPAAGARVELQIGDRVVIREITVGSNYVSQNSSLLHFGLGAAKKIDAVTIFWNAREKTQISALPINMYHTVNKIEHPVGLDPDSSQAR